MTKYEQRNKNLLFLILPHLRRITRANYEQQCENNWYFFTQRMKKYQNGRRPSRTATDGYWKATGADTSVTSNGDEIGTRKSLVYCLGRSPRGQKTDWLMHEFVLKDAPPIVKTADENDMTLGSWVLCRIYNKSNRYVRNHNRGGRNHLEAEENVPENYENELLQLNVAENVENETIQLEPTFQSVAENVENTLVQLDQIVQNELPEYSQINSFNTSEFENVANCHNGLPGYPRLNSFNTFGIENVGNYLHEQQHWPPQFNNFNNTNIVRFNNYPIQDWNINYHLQPRILKPAREQSILSPTCLTVNGGYYEGEEVYDISRMDFGIYGFI